MADSLPGIKLPQNNAQLGPNLYQALSATSGGFLNQRDQQPTGGPPGSPGVGPSSQGYAPASQLPSLPPEMQSNPMVTDPNRALNQQPNPQPNSSPTMPGLFSALQQGGNQGQPMKQFNNQG